MSCLSVPTIFQLHLRKPDGRQYTISPRVLRLVEVQEGIARRAFRMTYPASPDVSITQDTLDIGEQYRLLRKFESLMYGQ